MTATGPAARELVEAVRARTEGTPYALVETEDGFDLGLDLADATYLTLMYQRRLERSFTHEVRLDEATRTMSITDSSRELTWRRGADVCGGVPVPTVGARLSVARGRLVSRSFETTVAVREDGSAGRVVDYRFDSGESRDLVRGPARELGWREVRGTAEKIGLYVGVGTLVLLVVSGVVVGLLFLFGVL
ncbi:hypothetical protein [Nocardioides aurantiacus]|uniref:hypothetical protein n=1 Tax=Nocardioides aurantiacus TaxID=86796 RepID=UPI00403F50B3